MNGNVIRTITIRGTSEGLDKLQADLAKVAAGHKGVTVATEETEKASLSFEQTLRKQSLRLDEVARAQSNIARETKIADRALREGLIDQQRHADLLNLASQRYNTASQSTQKFAQQTGLARHELINLGRQAQDVGVSLASGQSPLTVLFQQGSQIADVFVSSRASVGSFFSQAIGWAGRFAASTAGVVTGITAIGGSALYMASSFASAQKEIDKVLSGIGAGSGVTHGGINKIAEGAAGGGMSISEARTAALEFAKTGKIYEQNIISATNVTREFAQALGIDAADATKQLAAALADPAKGALELNKSIRFLDADTLKYITTLQSMGQLQQAQNALLLAALPALARQAEQVGLLTRMWNEATRQLSLYFDQLAKQSARGFERVTGAELGGFTDQERLARARQAQQEAQSAVSSGSPGLRALNLPLLQAATAEVERLEKKLLDLAKATEATRFAQLSLDAQAFGQSLDQTGVRIATLEKGLADIAKYQAARLNQGLGLDQGMERQAQIQSVILAQSYEQQAVEQRKTKVIADNALQYQNVSTSTAQTLVQMEAQLGVAQAVTGAAEIDAQHWATIVQLLGTANTSLVTQQQLTSAIEIADAQRANSIARANAEADRMLHTLQQEGQLIRADTEEEKDRIKARQTYQDLIDKNVDSTKAAAVASQQLSNANESRWRKEVKAAEDAVKAINTAADAWKAYESGVISWSVANDEAAKANRKLATQIEASTNTLGKFSAANARLAREMQYIPFGMLGPGETSVIAPTNVVKNSLGQNVQGGAGGTSTFSYFNEMTSAALMGASARYGEKGFTVEAHPYDELIKVAIPTAQGLETMVNKMLAAGGTTESAIGALLSVNTGAGVGLASSAGGSIQQTISRLINLMPEDQKQRSVQMQLDALQGMPKSIARDELVQSLTQQLEQLTQATEENTQSQEAMTDVLSPYYSTDPRRTHLGFRAFGAGGIMTQFGELPLRQYAGGGVATSPQVSLFGEGSTPEAYVPVPAGRIPVEIKAAANSNRQRPVNVNIIVQGNADASTVAQLKSTAFQQAQAMRRMMG